MCDNLNFCDKTNFPVCISICIADLAHCQMNKISCSHQEIHVLFEHGFKLENTSNEL